MFIERCQTLVTSSIKFSHIRYVKCNGHMRYCHKRASYLNSFALSCNTNHCWIANNLSRNYSVLLPSSSSTHLTKSVSAKCIHRTLRLSRPRPVPPILWAIFRPVGQIGAALFGRYFRRWWFNLPPDKQRRLYVRFMQFWPVLLCGTLGLVILGVYYHVERTPVTGRLRFICVTRKQHDQVCQFQINEELQKYGDQMLPQNDYRVRKVAAIISRLLKANQDLEHVKNKNFTVHLINLPIKNAFVVPSDEMHIFVFTGMFDTVENEEQLGIVLSHEIAHSVLGHGLEQLSTLQLFDWLVIIALAALWAMIPFDITFLNTVISAKVISTAAAAMFNLPYSRRLELEADYVGLLLAAKACLDVRESYVYWSNMHIHDVTSGALIIPKFLSTHPDHDDRAQRLDALVDTCLKIREECHCPPLKHIDPRILADRRRRLLDEQLALAGKV